jgi:hypothetical protein
MGNRALQTSSSSVLDPSHLSLSIPLHSKLDLQCLPSPSACHMIIPFIPKMPENLKTSKQTTFISKFCRALNQLV